MRRVDREPDGSTSAPTSSGTAVLLPSVLLAVSRDGDWNGWISFFLGAIENRRRRTAEATGDLGLYDEMKQTVAGGNPVTVCIAGG